MIIQKNRIRNKISYISQLDATEKNIWVLQLNIADSKKNIKKYMLAGILLHIIKLKTTYSHKSHHYGGCITHF